MGAGRAELLHLALQRGSGLAGAGVSPVPGKGCGTLIGPREWGDIRGAVERGPGSGSGRECWLSFHALGKSEPPSKPPPLPSESLSQPGRETESEFRKNDKGFLTDSWSPPKVLPLPAP